MNTLRLFIKNNLEDSINWILINSNGSSDSGEATWNELAVFDDVQLEVYLNSDCCSILKTTVTDISTNKITEELVLNMLEESIADDIEEVKPIILRIDDDVAYVAIFNRIYYDTLVFKLENLNKTIRFIQSFVYVTNYTENTWVLFLNDTQKFVRTSLYEYFLLDDQEPIPQALELMLENNKPQELIVYTNNESTIQTITEKYKINCINTNEYNYGTLIWNFYNQKSTQFKIKFDAKTKTNLQKLYKTISFIGISLAIIWLINVARLTIKNISLTSQIKEQLQIIEPIKTVNKMTIDRITSKINAMKHERGFYDDSDIIPMFKNFLEVVSNVGNDKIIQINYGHNILKIFLNNTFNNNQFSSYKNILAIKHINAKIIDYKSYINNQKKLQNNNNNLELETQSALEDAAWVITLEPLEIFDKR